MPSALVVLHWLTPILLAIPAGTLIPSSPPPIQLPAGLRPITTKHVAPRRTLILWLLSAVSFTYLVDGALFIISSLIREKWNIEGRGSGAAWTVYVLGGVVIWSGLAVLAVYRDAFERGGLVASAAFGIVLELVVLIVQIIFYVHHTHNPASVRIPSLLHTLLPPVRLLLLPTLLYALSTPTVSFEPASPSLIASAVPSDVPGNETDGLLGTPQSSAANANSKAPYGTFNESDAASGAPSEDQVKTPKEGTAPKPPSEISWREYFNRFARLAPFLWPSKSRYLQVLASLCLVLLVIGRLVNLAVPQTLGKVVECLGSYSTGVEGKCAGGTVWPSVFVFVALRFCQGGGGVLSVGQNMLWAPVMQYSDREMSMNSFNHLLDLSLAFHTKRKTGEILRILDRGSAINNVFQILLMNVLPVLFDIGIACFYFWSAYGWSLALVIAVVMTAYVAVSVSLTTYRTKLRRQMVERDVVTRGIHTDVLMNWESVKYFTAENRESTRYKAAIADYQSAEIKVIGSLNLLNLTQNFIITAGLLAGSLIVAWRVTKGKSDAAHFVVFLTYLGQLYAPLNSLGMIYRQLNGGLVDAEKLLKLLEEEKEVQDKPGAKDLVVTDGKIEFQDVTFSYDGKVTALKDINFTIDKGTAVALVGESGGGKSSLLRLLYRFYDINTGAILIDGQDIRDVTQKSLRSAIGIVPQDAVLWNDTLLFNIGYGKEGASREEIIQAAKAASLYDRIMTFPLGFDTVVGERGVRLSGGERQRVSLARTILKSPQILVLDEATSALDTETEREVQKSLAELAKGRSSLMIAHRLSSVVNADKIIVLKNGSIIEDGKHRELIKKPNGVFAAMWKEQIRTNYDGSQSPLLEKPEMTIPDVGYSLDGEQPKVVAAAPAVPEVHISEPAPIMEEKAVEAEPFASSSMPPASATSEPSAVSTMPQAKDIAEDVVPAVASKAPSEVPHIEPPLAEASTPVLPKELPEIPPVQKEEEVKPSAVEVAPEVPAVKEPEPKVMKRVAAPVVAPEETPESSSPTPPAKETPKEEKVEAESAPAVAAPPVKEPVQEETAKPTPKETSIQTPTITSIPEDALHVHLPSEPETNPFESLPTSLSPSPSATPARSSSPSAMAFPSSRNSVPHSLSESGRTLSDGGSPADPETKKRNRLSSITGLVRRGSEKLKQEFKSSSSSSSTPTRQESSSTSSTPSKRNSLPPRVNSGGSNSASSTPGANTKRLSFIGKPKD